MKELLKSALLEPPLEGRNPEALDEAKAALAEVRQILAGESESELAADNSQSASLIKLDGEIYGKTAEDCISWEAEWRNDDVNMSAENQCDVDLSLEVRIQAVCKYTNCTEDGQTEETSCPIIM